MEMGGPGEKRRQECGSRTRNSRRKARGTTEQNQRTSARNPTRKLRPISSPPKEEEEDYNTEHGTHHTPLTPGQLEAVEVARRAQRHDDDASRLQLRARRLEEVARPDAVVEQQAVLEDGGRHRLHPAVAVVDAQRRRLRVARLHARVQVVLDVEVGRAATEPVHTHTRQVAPLPPSSTRIAPGLAVPIR